jgi:hypothetical protein
MQSTDSQRTQMEIFKPKPNCSITKKPNKIHKPGALVRPIVNWRNAPAYKIARFITDLLKTLAPLPYTYSVKKTLPN